MPNEFPNSPEEMHSIASRASVWIPWYFKRGAFTLFTAPLLFLLAYCIVVSTLGAYVQGLALLRASHAIFGFIGAFVAVSFGWIPLVAPPVLYYSLVKNLPGIWLRKDAPRRTKFVSSILALILLPLSAYLVYHGVTWGIGWIADRNPCAAFAAGVTGSQVPVNCP
jgi:hypothetical protein